MGVCAIQHRQIIGYFNAAMIVKHIGGHRSYDDVMDITSVLSSIIRVSGMLLYGYIICCLLLLYIEVISRSDSSNVLQFCSPHNIVISINPYYFVNSSRNAMNMLIFIIMLFVTKYNYRIPSTHVRVNLVRNLINIKKIFKNSTFLCNPIRRFSIWICSINLILIIITTPSIVNPGPTGSLSVLYQNVQGFINLNDLNKTHPPLNMTKLLEFQSFVYSAKPDIIILNETWLCKSILDSEIFPNNSYKVFRRDRTLLTHPLDPTKPKKYKTRGGGVLIAVKSDLDVTSVDMKSTSKAEVLSVFFKTKIAKKFCISTLYRTGILGEENFKEVEKHLNLIANDKTVQKHFLIGDINLNKVSWPLVIVLMS